MLENNFQLIFGTKCSFSFSCKKNPLLNCLFLAVNAIPVLLQSLDFHLNNTLLSFAIYPAPFTTYLFLPFISLGVCLCASGVIENVDYWHSGNSTKILENSGVFLFKTPYNYHEDICFQRQILELCRLPLFQMYPMVSQWLPREGCLIWVLVRATELISLLPKMQL